MPVSSTKSKIFAGSCSTGRSILSRYCAWGVACHVFATGQGHLQWQPLRCWHYITPLLMQSGGKEKLLPSLLPFCPQHGWLVVARQAKLTVGRTEMAAATVACCHGLCRDGPQQQCLATPGKVCPCSVSIFFLNMSSWRHEQLL